MSGSDHVYGRKVDKTGRSTGKFASSKTRKGHGPIGEQFFWQGRGMLESPAMTVVSGPALKILMRIGREHLAHGGAENGRLPVTTRTSEPRAWLEARSPLLWPNW